MDRKNEAIKLFVQTYGKMPQEYGLPLVGIYKEQKAFLYSDSKKAIEAYKMQQNILSWLMAWYMWPIIVAYGTFVIGLIQFIDFMNPLCVASIIFICVWIILFVVLYIKVKMTKRLVKVGKTLIYLFY